MFRFRRLWLSLAVAISLLPVTAVAGTCSSITFAPLNFGANIVPGGSAKTINTATTISVNCSSATSFSLALSEGVHATGSGLSAVRQLAGSAGSLTYGLFQDGARTIPWGDGLNVGSPRSGFGSGSPEPFLVYASLNVPATTPLGSYSDSIAITVSF